MPDPFLRLNQEDRREALAVAASASGRPDYLLEKDVWVVWALDRLCSAPFGQHLVFKGGTSLSKAHGVINRFSEDVDLTYDIRELLELDELPPDPIPSSRNQASRWTGLVRSALPAWLETVVLPQITAALDRQLGMAELRGDTIDLRYSAVTAGPGYVKATVSLEFGARATGEPASIHQVSCDAAQHLP